MVMMLGWFKPEAACVVRAEATGVSGSHAEALQARERRRRLTARGPLVFDESNLRVELRVGGNDDEMVNGVEAESHGVELSGGRGLEGESQACSSVEGL